MAPIRYIMLSHGYLAPLPFSHQVLTEIDKHVWNSVPSASSLSSAVVSFQYSITLTKFHHKNPVQAPQRHFPTLMASRLANQSIPQVCLVLFVVFLFGLMLPDSQVVLWLT